MPGTVCAKHPAGRPGKRFLAPFPPSVPRLAIGASSLVAVLTVVSLTAAPSAAGEALPAPPAAARNGLALQAGNAREATDTVFLVDSSGSNFRSDPAGVRKLLIEVFTTFAADRPGDRIAIGQFAGWEETSENKGAVILPLGTIPEDEEERAEFIHGPNGLRAALERMKPFGVGTDPNAALDLVLPLIVPPEEKEAAGEEAVGDGVVPLEGQAVPGDDILPGDTTPEDVAAEEARPAPNRLWAVMITDGDINVVEGAVARLVYIERAEENHGTASPETLALVAEDIFFNETLPRLKERGVTVTTVGLGRRAGEWGPFFERVKEAVGADALMVDGPLLGRTFTELLKSCPDRPPSETTNYGYTRGAVEPGAEYRIPFRVLPETRRTRAVFFGSNGEYEVSVGKAAAKAEEKGELAGNQERPGSTGGLARQAPPAAPKDLTGGKGSFRILEFTATEAGDYEFVVKSSSEQPVEVEVTLYPDVALDVELGAIPVAEEGGAFVSPAGMPLVCALSVLGGDGEVVENPRALPELNVSLEVSDAVEPGPLDLPGTPVAQEVTFKGLPQAETTAEVAVGGLGAGAKRLAVRLRAFPVYEATDQERPGPTGKKGEGEGDEEGEEEGEVTSPERPGRSWYIYEGPLKTFDLNLVPAVAVRFGFASAFAGQIVPLEGRFTVPVDFPPAEVVAVIEPGMTAGLSAGDVEEDRYKGSVVFPQPGQWRVARRDTPELLVIPGEPDAISVRERRMRVLRPGAPAPTPTGPGAGPEWEIKSLEFTVRFCEKAGVGGGAIAAYELPVLIEIDVNPDEVPEFPAASLKPSEALGKPGLLARLIPFRQAVGPDSLKVEIRPLGEIEPGSGRVEAKAVLSVTTNGVLPKDPGTAEFVAKIQERPGSTGGETSLPRDVEIALAFSDYWQKLIVLTWMYWGPALLVILLVLWWLLLARFKGQEIYLVSRLEEQTEPFHFLRGLCVGGRRQAFGTPEVENVAQFRIKGTKLFGGRVSVRALREGAMVAANNVQAAKWVRLRHGDELITENPEGAYCRYWYFDRPPTEQELAAMLAADAIELGPDEFVVEGL